MDPKYVEQIQWKPSELQIHQKINQFNLISIVKININSYFLLKIIYWVLVDC